MIILSAHSLHHSILPQLHLPLLLNQSLHLTHTVFERYTTITTPVSKTICILIPLNMIPCPHIPSLHEPKQELPPRTNNSNSRISTTATGTIRQLFMRKMGILKSCSGSSEKNTGTPTSQTTESAFIETGTQSVLPLTVFDGLRNELSRGFFGSSSDGHHLRLTDVSLRGISLLRWISLLDLMRFSVHLLFFSYL